MILELALAVSTLIGLQRPIDAPHRVTKTAERVLLSDGQTIDVYVHKHLYNGDDQRSIVGHTGTAVLRLGDGYTVGVFFTGDNGRAHPSSFEIWDKNADHILSVSIDSTNFQNTGTAAMIIAVNKKEFRLNSGNEPSRAEGAAEVRKAVAKLPKKFEEAVKAAVIVAITGDIEGLPAELQYLVNFMDVSDGTSITSSEPLTAKEAADMHSFISRYGVPGHPTLKTP